MYGSRTACYRMHETMREYVPLRGGLVRQARAGHR